MKTVHLFKVINDGMGAMDTPDALLRHAARKQDNQKPAPRPERQNPLAALFTVQEAF